MVRHRQILALAAVLLATIFAGSAHALDYKYDIAVVGGGCGGVAAALQAAKMGAKVIVLEPTEMLGGQMTSAAVCTMDDRGLTRTGIYKEFTDAVRGFYTERGKNVSSCYWGADTIAFEPRQGAWILKKMLDKAGVDVVFNAQAQSAKTKNGKVVSALFKAADETFTVQAKIFIDATECGDFIPLTPAAFRAGNSVSPHINKDGVIQDITYVAVIKKYPNGVPTALKVNAMPPNYEKYIDEFRQVVTQNGNDWPEGYPYNPVTHNEYRGLPNLESMLYVDSGDASSWKNVTKTCINWANDYPGMTYGNKKESMSVRYLTDRHFRRVSNLRAMEKTLAFIYYMQHELGMADWSVSDEGYTRQVADWKEDAGLAPYAEILKRFPCQPYVRESRRIVGTKTLTVKDVRRDPQLKRTLHSMHDAIALGEYPIDMHGMIEDKYLEADLGETKEAVPNDWQIIKAGLFQIPVGALIPEKTDGLLAAEKNISVSRAVNGATRLQPVTMLTGQACGCLAALAVKQNIAARDVKVSEVQKELLEAGDKLAIQSFKDIPPDSPLWKYAEYATVHGLLMPDAEDIFGPDTLVTFLELRDCVHKLTGLRNRLLDIDPFTPMTNSRIAFEWLAKLAADGKKHSGTGVLLKAFETLKDAPLTKGDLAKIIWHVKR